MFCSLVEALLDGTNLLLCQSCFYKYPAEISMLALTFKPPAQISACSFQSSWSRFIRLRVRPMNVLLKIASVMTCVDMTKVD